MSLKGALALVYWSLLSFPAAAVAWGLMRATDWLYEKGMGWLAVPIRIGTFLIQLAVLFCCVVTLMGLAYVLVLNFFRASRGLEAEQDSHLHVKGYILLLLLPVAMGVSGLLVALFNNWLDFGNQGLGLITIGYLALHWVLQIGSLVAIGTWVIVLPLFLHNRKSHIQ